MIHLQVVAGIANRIRALISGICLAEDLNIPLTIHWFTKDPACACRIDAIFDLSSISFPFVVTSEELWQPIECNSPDDMKCIIDNYNINKHTINIKSYGHFHQSDSSRWLKHLQNLKPSLQIKNQLEKLNLINLKNNNFNNKLFGIHIRRGDNIKAIEGSPLQSFIDIMNKINKIKDNNCIFVIATDDNNVKDKLLTDFKDVCIFPARKRNRFSEEGIIEGAIDFFSLALCPIIYGSFYSSFSEIAAKYGGSTLHIVR